MALYYVDVWEKHKKNETKPIWRNSIIADDINEAYVVGKAQFKLEMPKLLVENYTIIVSGDQFAKQGI